MGTMTIDVLRSQDYCAAGTSLPCAPNSLFALARKRARRGQIWSSLTGRTRDLLSLKRVRETFSVEAECDGGVRTVPIRQIRGSEGRSGYFDGDFNPLFDRARERWVSIARARQQGKHLPPVVLLQIGDRYFVRDGHHRISVARALGQIDVEARVSAWQVAGPLYWKAFEQPHRFRHAVDGLRSAIARQWERVVQGAQALHAAEEAVQGC